MSRQNIVEARMHEPRCSACDGSQPPKVLMLVANAGSTDARVRKQAESLVAMGHSVTVLGTTRAESSAEENLNGVTYLRAKLPGSRLLQFYSHIARNYLTDNASFKIFARWLGTVGIVGSSIGLITVGLLAIAAVAAWPMATSMVSRTPLTVWLVGAAVCVSVALTLLPMWRSAAYVAHIGRRLLIRIALAPFHLALRVISPPSFGRFKKPSALRTYGNISSALWNHAGTLSPRWDVVHAHDLNTLMAGVRIARRNGARLVFDAHEMATHEDDTQDQGERAFKCAIMSSLMPHVSKVVTVSVGFARHFESEYSKDAHVIYNTPMFPEQSRLGRDVRTDLGLSPDKPLCVYVGGINRRRASIELATAITLLPQNYHFAFVSNANQGIRDEIMKIVATSSNHPNVHWLPTVPHDEVVHYIRTADVSLVTRKPPTDYLNIQREFSMPNKLFESAMAGVPILAGNSSEIREFLKETGLGQVTDCSKPDELASGIVNVYENRLKHRKSGPALEQIRQRYGWANAQRVLAKVYDIAPATVQEKQREIAA